MRTTVLVGVVGAVAGAAALTTVYAQDAGVAGYCGNSVVESGETCDEGYANGQAGHCNATCNGVIRNTPFDDPDRAPALQSLSFGRVLGTRDYEVMFSLGELPGVGMAPGYAVAIRARSRGAAGACGGGCELLGARVTADGGAYVLNEAGAVRRFAPNGAGWREVPADPAVPFKSATASLTAGELVIAEPGGTLTRRFDAGGRERTRTTPWGALTLAYDGGGRLTGATNAAGAAMALAYDGGGRLSTVTDATGFTTTLHYAFDGHLISIDGPADGGVTPNVAIGWSGSQITSVARLGFNPVQIQYDGAQVSNVRDVDGNAYAFDSTATQLRVIDASMESRTLVYDAGRLVEDRTGAGTRRTYAYDGAGRLSQVRDSTEGVDRVTSYTYDAGNRITSVTDADGNVRTAEYDARGNLTRAVVGGRATTYAYDTADRMVSTTDALGRTTALTRDANGLVSSVAAGGITTSTTYTARGLVATSTDAFGATTTYGYDAHGRPTSMARPGTPSVTIARTPASGGEQVVVSRGGASSTTVTDRYGRMVSRSSSLGGSETVAYDQVTGLPSTTSSTFRGATRTRQQSYTNTGDAAQIWQNGVLRQWAARSVAPGNAWFPSDGTGGGGGSGSGMPTGGSGAPAGGSGMPAGGSGMPAGGSGMPGGMP